VQAEHRTRIAALQNAFIDTSSSVNPQSPPSLLYRASQMQRLPPANWSRCLVLAARTPMAGVAPGTRRGELCTNFMGCFTCPNAVITPDPSTVARLLQARDHLRGCR
jgi:hypothetical protein